jgi:hypothetical protein
MISKLYWPAMAARGRTATSWRSRPVFSWPALVARGRMNVVHLSAL